MYVLYKNVFFCDKSAVCNYNAVVLKEKYTEKAQLLDAVKDANAIIIRSDIIDAEVLDAAKELKMCGQKRSHFR